MLTHTNLEDSGMKSLTSWWKNLKKADIRYSEVPVRQIEEFWRGKVEYVRLTSLQNLPIHNSFSKSGQYLRSSSELVWRIGSNDSWSNTHDHGKIGREGDRSVISKVGTARSGLLTTDTKEEWSSSGRPLAYSSTEIWRMVERNQKHKSLWICGIHEKSLCWNVLQNHSRCGWWFWRKHRCLQTVFVFSWPREIGPPKPLAAGQRNIVVTWTILHLLTYHTSQLSKVDQGMKKCLCSNSMMGNIQGEWQFERIFHMQLAHLELSNANKEGSILKTRKKNQSDNDQTMKNCDQTMSSKTVIGMSTGRRHPLHLQQIGGIQENVMNHKKKNGKISNGGKSGEYSLSEPSALLQESSTFVVVLQFAFRHLRMSCTRRVVKTAHLVRVTQTHIFLVLRTCDTPSTHVGSRPNGQGHVDCLSPRAHQKSSVRVVFRCALLESQFSSPNQFSSFCSTPPPAKYGNEFEPLCDSARRPNRALPQFMSPNPSSKSAVSTRRSISLWEKQLRHGFQQSQECEVSANPFGVSGFQEQAALSGSQQQASSSVVNPWQEFEKPVRGVESFASVEGHCRKVKEIEISTVCNFLNWKRKELCLNRKVFTNPLKRKLNELIKENLQLRHDYLKHRLK